MNFDLQMTVERIEASNVVLRLLTSIKTQLTAYWQLFYNKTKNNDNL